MNITIINGPNLNLLGTREPSVYGNESFESFFKELQARFDQVHLDYFQSNVEGELVSAIQDADAKADAIIMNPAAYSHTSIAIADAIGAIKTPVVEVHISNVHARESYRQALITGSKSVGVISGLGLEGYALAVEYAIKALK